MENGIRESANNTTEKTLYKNPFLQHVITFNKRYLLITVILGIIYFTSLRILYPVPSFYSDSFTWIGAAKHNQPVTFRPIGYSKLIQFFKLFSFSDLTLIAAQYFTNLLANLFLFLTCTYFFDFNKVYKTVLFILLICNPLYLFYSNYVSSDAFFCSFCVIWFTLLIWILHQPSWYNLTAQLAVLAVLFELRFNAIILPAITTLGVIIIRETLLKKLIYISANFLLVALLIYNTTRITEEYTGTKTFSAFGGWQFANNAMHVLKHNKVDPSVITDQQTKELVLYVQPFFDTTSYIPEDGTSWYMWHGHSPLKKRLHNRISKGAAPFKAWNDLGPVYSKFAKTVILKKPSGYLSHFIIPNTKAYFFPPLEAYETYMENLDTIAFIAQDYYHYRSNKTPEHLPLLYSIIFNPWKYFFSALNLMFIFLSGWYFVSRNFKTQTYLFTHSLLCFAGLYLANFFFIVLLAPSVLRYHIFIITLAFPFILYLMELLKCRACNTQIPATEK